MHNTPPLEALGDYVRYILGCIGHSGWRVENNERSVPKNSMTHYCSPGAATLNMTTWHLVLFFSEPSQRSIFCQRTNQRSPNVAVTHATTRSTTYTSDVLSCPPTRHCYPLCPSQALPSVACLQRPKWWYMAVGRRLPNAGVGGRGEGSLYRG